MCFCEFFCNLASQTDIFQYYMYRDRLLVEDRIEEVEKLPLFIDTLCENAGIDATHAFNLNLALEEALVNVIQYAYPKDGLTHEITLDAECDENMIVFTLRDSGTPFDPTQRGDVDTTLSAQERQIGGLGIFLVKQLMDEVSYEYVDGQNVLVMSKRILESRV